MKHLDISYYAFLAACVVPLAVFATWALFATQSLMSLIGFQSEDMLGIVEFRSFYGGLELGLVVFLLLPSQLLNAEAKVLACVCTFGFTGLTRSISIIIDNTYSFPFIGIAIFELVILVWGILQLRSWSLSEQPSA